MREATGLLGLADVRVAKSSARVKAGTRWSRRAERPRDIEVRLEHGEATHLHLLDEQTQRPRRYVAGGAPLAHEAAQQGQPSCVVGEAREIAAAERLLGRDEELSRSAPTLRKAQLLALEDEALLAVQVRDHGSRRTSSVDVSSSPRRAARRAARPGSGTGSVRSGRARVAAGTLGSSARSSTAAPRRRSSCGRRDRPRVRRARPGPRRSSERTFTPIVTCSESSRT